MTPEQRNFLMEIERRGAPVGYLCTYVDSLLAAERAAVVTAMLEYYDALDSARAKESGDG